jgi:hypothetical protein
MIVRRSLASSEAWTQDVFAQGEPALLIVGGDLGCRVKIEPSVLPAQVALGHRMSVGIEHDAQGLALVGRTGGRGTGGGRCQEPSEQRIFLTHGLVGHHVDLTVARRRDQRDDAAPL